MKLISWLKIYLFMMLALILSNAYAEFYFGTPCLTYISLDCHSRHDKRSTHYTHTRHPSLSHKHHLEKYCNQDLATGDDNPCLHPDMQIN